MSGTPRQTSMRLGLLLFLCWPALAFAQPAGESLDALSQRWSLLEAHRARLESLLSAQVGRISRLKAQPAGVRRDFQLSGALRENQDLARKLTALQDQIRDLSRTLALAYERAIAQASSPAERRRLEERKAQITRQVESNTARIVTREEADPDDSAEDLEEKADLLKDSEEKVKRQLRVLRAQIARLQLQAKLKRHGRAVEDSPFVEDSPRRLSQTKTRVTTVTTKPGAASDSAGEQGNPAAPNYAGPPSNKSGAGGNLTADSDRGSSTPALPETRTSSELSLTVRGVIDPSLVEELKRAGQSGSVAARIAALEKASRRLEEVARGLAAQSQALRQRAKTLK